MENHNEMRHEVEKVLEKIGLDVNSKGFRYLTEVVTLTICQENNAAKTEK